MADQRWLIEFYAGMLGAEFCDSQPLEIGHPAIPVAKSFCSKTSLIVLPEAMMWGSRSIGDFPSLQTRNRGFLQLAHRYADLLLQSQQCHLNPKTFQKARYNVMDIARSKLWHIVRTPPRVAAHSRFFPNSREKPYLKTCSVTERRFLMQNPR